MRQRVPKFEVAIESPCSESWDNMSGTATRRHCASCQKYVHNFATMTPRQIERAIADHDGHLCARITRREDGTMVTTEALRNSSFAAKAASLVLGAALSTGAAYAQSNSGTEKAIVSGNFKAQDGGALSSQGTLYLPPTARASSRPRPTTTATGKPRSHPAPTTSSSSPAQCTGSA